MYLFSVHGGAFVPQAHDAGGKRLVLGQPQPCPAVAHGHRHDLEPELVDQIDQRSGHGGQRPKAGSVLERRYG